MMVDGAMVSTPAISSAVPGAASAFPALSLAIV